MPTRRNLAALASTVVAASLLAAAGSRPARADSRADPLANCTSRDYDQGVTRLELEISSAEEAADGLDLPLKLTVKFRQGKPLEYPLRRDQDVWFKPDLSAFTITGSSSIDLMPKAKPSHYWFTGPTNCSYRVRGQLCAAVFSFEAYRVTVTSQPPGTDLDFEILSMGEGDALDRGCVSKAEWRLDQRGQRMRLRLKDAAGNLIWPQPAEIDVAALLQGGPVPVKRAQPRGVGSRETANEVLLSGQKVPQVNEITVSLAVPQQ